MDSKLTIIGDEELTAVAGGHAGHGRRKKMLLPPGFVVNKAATATATGGSNEANIDVFAPGAKGDINVYVEQDASADASATVS